MTTPEASIEAELAAEVAARVRRGVRVAALVSPLIFAGIILAELAAHRRAPLFALGMRAFPSIALGILAWQLRPDASQRRTFITGALASATAAAYALVMIGTSGGAASPEVALFPIALVAMSVLVPLTPPWILATYAGCGAAFIVTVSFFTPTEVASLFDANKLGVLACVVAGLVAYLQYRVLCDIFAARQAIREESRRSVLALERARIARDLHDHIGARLTGIALRAERERRRLPKESAETLTWIQDTVRLCLEELRDTIWALSHSEQDARELIATLRRRAEDIADAAGLELRWNAEGEDMLHLSPGVSIALSAILREGLTNTVRHSQATHVSVELKIGEGAVTLEILDDGRGIDGRSQEGRGLNNMRVRAREQQGDVTVENQKDKGLRVFARIPLSPKPISNKQPMVA